jgi:hypothetical protein
VTATFDVAGRPVAETRTASGDTASWATKTITYQTDFVDPATLPTGFLEPSLQALSPSTS